MASLTAGLAASLSPFWRLLRRVSSLSAPVPGSDRGDVARAEGCDTADLAVRLCSGLGLGSRALLGFSWTERGDIPGELGRASTRAGATR